ncbi:MAG: tRNA 2-thiouridine(34) synthase MnmA [Patescibacteria group bacterium]
MNTKQISPNIPAKSKVFVGLSGGVDSAVSAALLKSQGFKVVGVFIKAWQPEWLPCTWREERRDAMKACLTLGIPFLFFDFEKEYKQGVVDRMLLEYKAGRTPNPDVLCNKEIKFGIFWQRAKALGADYIATGHYLSGEKDQSYFLWTLTRDDFSHTLFPVGYMEKSEVRKLAKKYNLSVAEKKDSQGICFLGDVSMGEFLSHYIKDSPGRIFNTEGEVIGKHKGLIYYTIGKRHGFDVNKKLPESGPFYIVAKDIKTNSLLVSDKESEILEFSPTKIKLKDINWIREPREEVIAQIRYRGEKMPVKVSNDIVEFGNPVQGLSLGQSIVFYSSAEASAKEGDICLGGAVMDKVVAL